MPRSSSIIPIIHEEPCGTPDELRAQGLPLNQYGSCSARVESNGVIENVGCFNYGNCLKSECPGKGEKVENGGGPRHHVLRILQKMVSGKVEARHVPCPCFQITDMREAHEGRGTKENPVLVQVIAVEKKIEDPANPGQMIDSSFLLPGSGNFDETVPGEGVKRRSQDKVWNWPLKPFPRPKDNPQLAAEAFNAAVLAQGQADEQAALAASFGGLAQQDKKGRK